MPTISFTKNLRRHVDCPPAEVAGESVAECLAAYFVTYPRVRSYVLDEQGSVRKHVVVFVGADQLRDPARQTDPVEPATEITVMQALSGG
ncbi:MAG: MoaD/ThiS family protein [Ilumatobacteraceae bacterium]